VNRHFLFALRKSVSSNMVGGSFGNFPLITTVFYCLACLVAPIVLCVIFIGPKTILEYASESKPYSILLDPTSYEALPSGEDSTRIICFGDSNYFYPPHEKPSTDSADTYMSNLLYEEVSNRSNFRDLGISQRAFASAGMFDFYCMAYEALEFSPDLIIVPINWRSFGVDEWDTFGNEWMEGSYWFHPELSALAPLRDGLSANYENPVRFRGITAAKQLQYKISFYTLYPIGIKAWALENAKSLLAALREDMNPSAFAAEERVATEPRPPAPVRKAGRAKIKKTLDKDALAAFPMKIEDSHLTYRCLAPLANVASRRGTKILFYVWPVDQEYLEKVGRLDKSSFEQSKKLLREAVDQENVYFADLSGLLEHKDFYDNLGHCMVEGRQKIAQALAPEIIDILNGSSAQPE